MANQAAAVVLGGVINPVKPPFKTTFTGWMFDKPLDPKTWQAQLHPRLLTVVKVSVNSHFGLVVLKRTESSKVILTTVFSNQCMRRLTAIFLNQFASKFLYFILNIFNLAITAPCFVGQVENIIANWHFSIHHRQYNLHSTSVAGHIHWVESQVPCAVFLPEHCKLHQEFFHCFINFFVKTADLLESKWETYVHSFELN